MLGIVQHWEDGFARHHPGVRFETHLQGTASAIGGLSTEVADIVFTGTDVWPVDIDGFEEMLQYKPLEIHVLTGSFDTRTPYFALVVLAIRAYGYRPSDQETVRFFEDAVMVGSRK